MNLNSLFGFSSKLKSSTTAFVDRSCYKKTLLSIVLLMLVSINSWSQTPPNTKIAFIGDAGIGSNADAVLNLILTEGAEAVAHAGDLDYSSNPTSFENNITGILGANFPYFYSAGNHDVSAWNGSNGYQANMEARFNRIGLPWTGQLGVLSSFTYKGIFFTSTSPDDLGISPTQAANYIRDQLAANDALWSVSLWHKNQTNMQVGGKGNEAGWGVYEESRKGGALIATGHEHSYSRTYEMAHMQNLTVSTTSDTVNLAIDDPRTTGIDEGRSFAFVSGLGGRSIRSQQQTSNIAHWASIYTSNQNATHGALFGEFNVNGQPDLAHFYFKNINGVIIDEFYVRSQATPPVQYTLTTNTTGQGSVSLNPSGGTYAEGTVVALTATPAVGWKFDGWSGAATGTQNPVNVTMSANKTVTATFSAIPNYTLTTNTVGQGSVALNPAGGIYAEGTIVALTATPALGWKFDGWSGAATGTQNPVNVTMDANKTVTATFSAIPTYTLTTNTVGQGSVSLNPAGGTYNENTVVTLTATPALGYKFDGWSGAATGTQNSVTVTMNANKTVTATFSAIPTYTLTTNTVGQGTVSLNPAGGTYNENTVVALTATPTAGYKFDGWSGAATGTQNPVNVTMNANKTVTAAFSALPSYTLTTTVVGTGTISLSPSGGSYVQGTVVSVTANAGTGYQFNGWSGDLSGTANPTSITMDANKTVTANFGLIPTEVILTQNTSGGDKMEVNEGQRGAQSFKYASSDYKISKVVVYLSRDQEAPTGNLHFSIGTGVNTGAVSGSTVNITPSQVTNTSEGSSFTAHEIVYSSPVGPFNAGTTYYLNMENDAPNGKKYYFEFDPDNNYSNGSYFKELSDEEKDMRFQIWGGSIGNKAAGYDDNMTDMRIYPNPAKDQIVVEYNSRNPKIMEIRNITGLLLKTVQLTDGNTTVDISELKQGIYILSTPGTSMKPIRLTIE